MDIASKMPKFIRRDDENGTFAVHRSAFTDPDILAREYDRIFERCWLYACHVSELRVPGDFIARRIANRRILLTRGADGQIRAFYNTCAHKGALICRLSAGNARSFTCPYHAWTYDNAGHLIGLPTPESFGPYFEKSNYNLTEVGAVDTCHGFVFIRLKRGDVSLSEYLSGAAEQLGVFSDGGERGMEIAPGTQLYSIKSNWKLLLENSSDGYHLFPVHRRYVDYVEQRAKTTDKMSAQSRSANSTVTALGNGHSLTQSTPPLGGRITAYWHPMLGDDKRSRIEARRKWFEEQFGAVRAAKICDTSSTLTIFPNLMINDVQAITIRQFFPRGPGSLDVAAWALLPAGQNPEDRAFSLDSFLLFFGPAGFATPDDVDILESCQEGFENREVEWSHNSRGMLANRPPRVDDEFTMREFWTHWDKLMQREC